MQQVDLITKTIRLDPPQTKNEEAKEITLTSTVFELAREAVSGKDPQDFLLMRGRKPIRDFRDTWKKLCDEAGLPGLLVHDLRRSAARQMRQAGVAETTIMDMAGWKTRAMFKRYAITNVSDTRAAVRKLEQARTENSHSFSNSQASEAQAETETKNRMVN